MLQGTPLGTRAGAHRGLSRASPPGGAGGPESSRPTPSHLLRPLCHGFPFRVQGRLTGPLSSKRVKTKDGVNVRIQSGAPPRPPPDAGEQSPRGGPSTALPHEGANEGAAEGGDAELEAPKGASPREQTEDTGTHAPRRLAFCSHSAKHGGGGSCTRLSPASCEESRAGLLAGK